MHRSRLCAIGVDVPAEVHDPAATFWTGALGGPGQPDEDGTYVEAGHFGPGREVFVQRLGSGPARIHLDIETDDVEAEVARLEQLGATRVEQVRSWWVMRDPAGLAFCVVPPQSDHFPEGATEWP